MTRDSSQSHSYKISEYLVNKPSSFAHKEMSILCFSDDQDWPKFDKSCWNYHIIPVHSRAVIAWLESMTRLESWFLVTRTRLEWRWEKWWLDSTRVTVNDSSQSHFYKISEFLIDKPTSCALKEKSMFCFSDDQDWCKFSVCLSSRSMLHFKDQVPQLA